MTVFSNENFLLQTKQRLRSVSPLCSAEHSLQVRENGWPGRWSSVTHTVDIFSFWRELTKVTKGFCRGKHSGWRTDASLPHFPTPLSTGDWEPGCHKWRGPGLFKEASGRLGPNLSFNALLCPRAHPFCRPHSGWAQPQGNQHAFSPRGWFYLQSLISRPMISINWSYMIIVIDWGCMPYPVNYVARLPVYSNICTKYDLPLWNYVLIWSHIVY